ncbi:HEAT repeat domain-containing protein [Phytomonospora endophytica]|uniref:HEAT repeat domain-containing protein n=1 Tax=Phytomonospora endophytica TaxID=714109 RepID=A0A841FQV6_9ACTN|nr:HEAT repeat domain-containing protein [Phytomonospora endophytica]MBB6038446.1 hypothetical protein [Phytomonospora endophytica]GIG64375.1 hypothetical protein Pen01_06700 [Phytomonospora endophytica]
MAMFVHLTPRVTVDRVRRSGLRAGKRGGVFCFPLLTSYTLTHQWMRELGRWSRQRDLVAVDIRLPDAEPVSVGRYHAQPAEVTAAEAVARIRALDDPRGWEVFLPRGVSRREVHRIRGVSHGVGWRYRPDAHGTKPCTCMGCRVTGAYGAQRLLRRPFAVDKPPPPVRTLLARLEKTDPADVKAIVDVLDDLHGRRRGPIHLLAHLADHPDADVRRSLAYTIRRWRTPGVAEVLARLAEDPDEEVREWATED